MKPQSGLLTLLVYKSLRQGETKMGRQTVLWMQGKTVQLLTIKWDDSQNKSFR